MPAMRYSIADTAGFTCELAGFDLSEGNGLRFSDGFSSGKVMAK